MTVPVSLGRPFAPEAVEVASSLASRALPGSCRFFAGTLLRATHVGIASIGPRLCLQENVIWPVGFAFDQLPLR
jgi:hypothetical protein